jgi:ABC-type phosphate/phosphonate transport system ATPase subunit
MSMPKLDIREIIQVLESQGLVEQAEALKSRLNPTIISNLETARRLAQEGKLTIARESVNEVVNWILVNHPNPESILGWFRRRVNKDD